MIQRFAIATKKLVTRPIRPFQLRSSSLLLESFHPLKTTGFLYKPTTINPLAITNFFGASRSLSTTSGTKDENMNQSFDQEPPKEIKTEDQQMNKDELKSDKEKSVAANDQPKNEEKEKKKEKTKDDAKLKWIVIKTLLVRSYLQKQS
jgi:hypothetical protein